MAIVAIGLLSAAAGCLIGYHWLLYVECREGIQRRRAERRSLATYDSPVSPAKDQGETGGDVSEPAGR